MKKILILTALAALAASAQQMVYVATTGNDANSCNNKATPCKTWIGALAQNEIGGQVMALDSGDFGRIFFTAPHTIDGGDHGAFASGPTPVLINMSTDQGVAGPAIIRNIHVHSDDTNNAAVQVTVQVNGLVLDHVTVDHVGGDELSSSTVGMSANLAANIPFVLKDVSIFGFDTGVAINGPQAAPAASAILQNVVIVGGRQSGLSALDASVTIRNSSIGGGFYAFTTGILLASSVTSPVSLIDNTQVLNSGTGIFLHSGTLRLSNAVISNNTTGINNTGGTLISFRNNVFAGNGTDGAPALTTSLK